MTSDTTGSSAANLPVDQRIHHVYYFDDQQPSTSVVIALSETLGTDPMDLHPRLYDVLDPDALDRLFSQRDGDDPIRYGDHQHVPTVAFDIGRCHVEVVGRCRVTVTTCRP